MSLSPDTVLQVVDIIRKAVEIYQKIQDGPEKMMKLGRRMERLCGLLIHLENHIRAKSKQAHARLRKSQTEDLLAIIDDTKQDCNKVYELFDKWENNIGPFGIKWRFTGVAQAYFTLGTSSEKLEALAKDIEDHRRDIDQYMGFMGIIGIHANQDGIKKLQQDNDALKKQIDSIHRMIKDGQSNTALAAPVGTPVKDQGKGKKPSPSPSPLPLKKDYKIAFIDPSNESRSVIAGTLVKLWKEWTVKTGGDWRVQEAHSKGFFVKNECDCIDVIENMQFSHPSYKMAMIPGGKKPRETAIAALFDNKSYDYPFKKTVKAGVEARQSRGVKRSIFKYYDFILVLTAREHDNMITLRKALVAKDGKDAAPKGKGKVLHLGRYLTLDGIPREIVEPPKDKDGKQSREDWNWKVSQLKTAIKAFLKQEFKWKQPDSKAEVKS